jgi:hypothetical protein
MAADSQYFASKDANECSAVLMSKVDSWCNTMKSNGYLDKIKSAWNAYHGAYYSDVSSGHQITFGGVEGELTNLPVNHLRNLAQHVLVMTTATRPTMEARATNTDYKSLTQTLLANGLLDYYMREKRLEKHLKIAVEMAIVMGSGYIKMAWNGTSGELYDFNEETQSPIYEGDVEFYNMSPFDVIVDSTKESQNHDWILCRTWKNRFDLAAKYPEVKDKILGLPTKSDLEHYRMNAIADDTTDDVAVYEFYHRRSEALPDGRYLLFLGSDLPLYDGTLPYRTLPIFRIAPSDILGTPYGYTTVFDLLPLQEALNSLYSTILSNQSAFGVQNILVPRGADISLSQLSGGLNIIEANIQVGKPEALNLTQTPAEIFKFAEMLKQEMETLSGVNSVARGNPEASLQSGAALALIQSMAIQFMSGLQASYVQLIEDVGSALILMLRDFAAVPRVAAIVGKGNRAFMKEFKGDDLSSVNRVIVDMGNPLARTTAGRVEMAQQMLQMGIIKDPHQYFTVINTGKLDVLTEGIQSELLLIKGENEKMMNGEQIPVIDVDMHAQHISEHKAILSDPDLRMNPELLDLVLGHIQAHVEALRQVHPDLLMILGQQPLAPQGGPGMMPPGMAPGAPPQGGPMAQQPPPPGAPPQAGAPQDLMQQAMPGSEPPQMPSLPTPPAPFENNPINPAAAMMPQG